MKLSLGMIAIGGMLVLGACSEEGQSVENNMMGEEVVGEEVVEETETPEVETAEEPTTEATEATVGEASPLLKKGDSTSFIFNEIGDFSIYCEPHPVMKMNVVVEEGAELSDDVSLEIVDYEFSEETITVAPGAVITWTNQDSAQHNVAFE
ncbi:plastocyanin/azurin family copper-binding protein [Paenisporosarcina quisquiliarum]|uniref:plastocyanin/azurin family copper-binding protein n=1 Tax=Paenisporosarcina quisquiliarum TaxID=365346 RepID=UPI003734C216